MSKPTTVHTFTNLGLRTMPIGQTNVILARDEHGKKQIRSGDKTLSFNDVMPANWTNVYGRARTEHNNTPLGGLICGQLTAKQKDEVEVVALDCDNAQAWELFTALHPDYKFKFKSRGKPGGTILYLLCENLLSLHQYSIKNDTIHFDYMARRESGANAMVYLPTTANETKEPIEKGAELDYAPKQVVDLLKLLKPRPVAVQQATNTLESNMPFNAPLVKQFVIDSKAVADGAGVFGKLDETPLVERVYRIFTPLKFRAAKHYTDRKWLHPNSEEVVMLGSWSEYIVGVSAIAGSDPSIDPELYADFMQAINAQVDDPMPPKRFMDEVVSPMVLQKSSIQGKPIWRYNEKWDQTSHTIINQYGENLEYYTLENAANKFIEFNHSNKELIEIQGARSLRDQIYSKDTDPQQECPAANIVKKLKLIRLEESVRLPLGIFTDSHGHTLLNTAEPSYSLRVLRDPSCYTETVDESNLYVQAFNIFIDHLVNSDAAANLFMKQVIAFHGKRLENIPVILYMVGVGGAGKSHFAQFIEQLFGSNTTSRPSAAHVTGRFNEFLVDTAVLILSETNDASNREREGIKAVLKTVTGEKTLDIEPKGRPVRRNVPVFALPILLANEPWYQEDSADRRLFSIMPKSSMLESKPIEEFEQRHGLRIIDFITEGIKAGTIAKYISTFCPKVLPAVPLTEDKQLLSMEQSDPIMVVKNIISSGNWFKLFDLMEEFNATLFFTCMESPKLRDKDSIFKNQITELIENMRGTDTFTLTDATISKAFTIRWMPNQAAQYRPRKDNPLAMKMGYIKWRLNVRKPYEDWKLAKLTDGE